jgi:site-specific DNA-methyltransferase (adenine-specific)
VTPLGLSAVMPRFKSVPVHWSTPPDLYLELDREFRFTLDPCPLDRSPSAGLPLFGKDGLLASWCGERVYCNPPYGRGVALWLAKARQAELAVYLLPARTDTRWWHEHAMHADEIRFLRGRLRFGDATVPAPFPSMLLVYGR